MEILHTPILLAQIKKVFKDCLATRDTGLPPARLFDGTFGRGGHTSMMLGLSSEVASEFTVVATDQDPEAIAFGENHFKKELASRKLQLVHQDFLSFLQNNQGPPFTLALLDLGVSSPQLDEGRRGFSFNKDGPLDMRMNPQRGISAAELLKTASEEDLMQIFHDYGEIEKPRKVVQKIIAARQNSPLTQTLQLAQLIESTVPAAIRWKRPGFHPATLYFQALRIFINRELEQLEKALPLLIHQLESRGLLAVLTFHSLEDRLVKNAFKDHPEGEPLFKKVIQADASEAQHNPRSRSAKLRVFIKQRAAPRPKNKYAHLVGR